jgi:SAM-dependent methyltransferase
MGPSSETDWRDKRLEKAVDKKKDTMRRFLHVGCGPKQKKQTTPGFDSSDWQEVRVDIDKAVSPDIIGTMLDMSSVPSGSMDAVYSSHNIEHLYSHEVPIALAEFKRVLKPDGFAVITCPDLQSVCALVAADKLMDTAYNSPAGPITPLDILYGHRPQIAAGNLYMAHKCGFTQKTLAKALLDADFANIVGKKRAHPKYDLWALATLAPLEKTRLRALGLAHFPQ